MKFVIITLFPEMFEKVLGTSMMWKAQEKGLVEFEVMDLRKFGIGPRRQVDDAPYGGGDGMLMRVEPIFDAVDEAQVKSPKAKVALMTPKGALWNQGRAREFAEANEDLIIICPHYEGYDERILEVADYQISIGQYILTGGELPAMVVVDSVVRLVPGVLGGETSAEIESFSDGDNLEYPQYTRPEEFRGLRVPEVLLSGNHGEIARWRAENAPKGPLG